VGQRVGHEAGHANGNGNGKADGSGGDPPAWCFLRDTLATSGGVLPTTTAEEVYRFNLRRTVSITANVATQDLGKVRRAVQKAIAENGEPPRGVQVDVRGQLNTLALVQTSLGRGLLLAILAIALLLTAYFQSIRLALVSVSAVPVTLCGVGLMLWATGTTLNLQSFMGAIMALGVSVANAILLVTFAERARLTHGGAVRAAVEGGRSRLPPHPDDELRDDRGNAADGGRLLGRWRSGGPTRPRSGGRAGRFDTRDTTDPAGGVRGSAA